MRSFLGADHAEFTYLGPQQLGVTSFGASLQIAENLSGRLENCAHADLTRRGLGPVTGAPGDSGADSDGDPEASVLARPLFSAHSRLPRLHFEAMGT
jgi:hypothetical protein